MFQPFLEKKKRSLSPFCEDYLLQLYASREQSIVVMLCHEGGQRSRVHREVHGEQDPARERSISTLGLLERVLCGKWPRNRLRRQCLRAWGAVCYSSVTNGSVAGFCRLQLPEIVSQVQKLAFRQTFTGACFCQCSHLSFHCMLFCSCSCVTFFPSVVLCCLS